MNDCTLSAAQKHGRPEAWEEDLKTWLQESAESTTGREPGSRGALLQRVLSCLEQLRSVEQPGERTNGESPTRNPPIPVRRVSRMHWIVNSLRRES